MTVSPSSIDVRAAVAREPGTPLAVERVSLRDLKPNEVLIQNRAAGICHTDAMVVRGAVGLPLPIVAGHEGAGVVLAVGEAVTLVSEGDHVVVAMMPECGRCRVCLSGRSGACETTFQLISDPIFRQDGVPLASMAFPAAFASHTIAPETALVTVPDDVPFEAAALLGCGVSTGVGAVRKTARVDRGSSVIVFGLGSIGLNVVQAARLAGAARIIALDTKRHRRESAVRFGATEVLDPADLAGDVVSHLTQLTGGGADFVFECVGSTDVLRDAVAISKPFGGVCVGVGAIPFDETIALPGGAFLYGRSLLGTFVGDIKPRSDMPEMISEYRAGTLELDALVTTRIGLDEINDGLRLLESGTGIRTVIVHD